MPGLGVHRRRRPLGIVDDLLDHRARHRLLLEPAHAAARVDQFLKVHAPLSVCSCGLVRPDGKRTGQPRQAQAGSGGLLLDRRKLQAAAATESPRTLCCSIKRATRPDSLRLLDKVAQEGGAGRIALLRSDRLLYGGKLTIENAGAGKLFHICQKPRTQTGQCLQPLIAKLREAPRSRLRHAARSHA